MLNSLGGEIKKGKQRTPDPTYERLVKNGLSLPITPREIELPDENTKKGKGAAWDNFRLQREMEKKAANVFTPEERYNLIKETGPDIREKVESIMDRGLPKEEAQSLINTEVRKIRNKAKQKMIRQLM